MSTSNFVSLRGYDYITPGEKLLSSTSGASKYIPFYTVRDSKSSERLIIDETKVLELSINSSLLENSPAIDYNDNVVIKYSLPKCGYNGYVSRRNGISKKYADLTQYLTKATSPCLFYNSDINYYVLKSCLYVIEGHNVKLLMCLAGEADHITKLRFNSFFTNETLDTSKLKMFIHPDFIFGDKHKTLYRKIKDEFINDFVQIGVEMEITTSINNKLFVQPVENATFNTIQELDAHLETFNDLLIE